MKKILKAEMKWPYLILLAILSAALTAIFNCIPALEQTSFIAPAVTLELWAVLGIYIAVNCKGYVDAMIKVFVFFLISQPLIYLIEVPFKAAGFSLFRYYPYWGMITLLTIPAAALAYRMKKDDILSALILSAANFLIIWQGISWGQGMIYNFPRYLIAVIFCFGMPFVMTFLLFKEKRTRLVACLLAAAIIIGGCLYQVLFPEDSSLNYPLEAGEWTAVVEPETGLQVTVGNEDITFVSHTNGTYQVTLPNTEGKEMVWEVSVDGADHYISVLETTPAG